MCGPWCRLTFYCVSSSSLGFCLWRAFTVRITPQNGFEFASTGSTTWLRPHVNVTISVWGYMDLKMYRFETPLFPERCFHHPDSRQGTCIFLYVPGAAGWTLVVYHAGSALKCTSFPELWLPGLEAWGQCHHWVRSHSPLGVSFLSGFSISKDAHYFWISISDAW